MALQSLPSRRVIRRCPYCGARIQEADTCCPVCGEALIQISRSRQPRRANPIPPMRSLVVAQQQGLTAVGDNNASTQLNQRPTTDLYAWRRPLESVYVRCPTCGAQNGIAALQCDVCGQLFSSVMPVDVNSKPIAMWSPRLHRAMPAQRLIQATDAVAVSEPGQPKGDVRLQLPRPRPTPLSHTQQEETSVTPSPEDQDGAMSAVRAQTNLFAKIAVCCMALMMLVAGLLLFWVAHVNSAPGATVAKSSQVQSTSAGVSQSSLRTAARAGSRPLSLPTPTVSVDQQPTEQPLLGSTQVLSTQDAVTLFEPTPAILVFHSSPVLISPQNDARIQASDGQIVLSWSLARPLAAEEFFVLHIQALGAVDTPSFRTKTTDLAIHADMLGVVSGQQYTWWVTIQRRMGVDSKTGSPVYQDLSPLSEVRRFNWITKL